MCWCVFILNFLDTCVFVSHCKSEMCRNKTEKENRFGWKAAAAPRKPCRGSSAYHGAVPPPPWHLNLAVLFGFVTDLSSAGTTVACATRCKCDCQGGNARIFYFNSWLPSRCSTTGRCFEPAVRDLVAEEHLAWSSVRGRGNACVTCSTARVGVFFPDVFAVLVTTTMQLHLFGHLHPPEKHHLLSLSQYHPLFAVPFSLLKSFLIRLFMFSLILWCLLKDFLIALLLKKKHFSGVLPTSTSAGVVSSWSQQVTEQDKIRKGLWGQRSAVSTRTRMTRILPDTPTWHLEEPPH